MDHSAAASSSEDLRVQAVLALFHGDSIRDVSERYGIGRSVLYKIRSRALEAIRQAMNDHA